MSCAEGDCNCSQEDCNCLCCLCVWATQACAEQATHSAVAGDGRPESEPSQATLEEPLRMQLPPLYLAMERQ